MVKKKGERFYRIGNKYRVHGYNKEGQFRILRWEDIPEDIREYVPVDKKGKRRVAEWTRYYEYRGDASWENRNWEIKLQLPEGYDSDDVEKMMDKIMDTYIINPATGESTVDWFTKGNVKLGDDVIEYTDEEYIRYKIVDNARPQYKYPKDKLWGDYEE